MKTDFLDINGKKIKEIILGKCFSQEIREDIILKSLEARKRKQPYAPSPVAGNQQSASGKLNHRRHVWKSAYGRAISRVPRKQMSRSGTQFNWVAAAIPSVRGGRRAHPPKILSMMNEKKINKKELKIAVLSAISATASENSLKKKYSNLKDKKLQRLPIVVEPKLLDLKTKEFLNSLKKILGNLFEVSVSKKKIRSGKGTFRGRKYKKNLGAILILGNKEESKSNLIESRKIKDLNVEDLAKGGPGRITIYTQEAIKELEKKI